MRGWISEGQSLAEWRNEFGIMCVQLPSESASSNYRAYSWARESYDMKPSSHQYDNSGGRGLVKDLSIVVADGCIAHKEPWQLMGSHTTVQPPSRQATPPSCGRKNKSAATSASTRTCGRSDPPTWPLPTGRRSRGLKARTATSAPPWASKTPQYPASVRKTWWVVTESTRPRSEWVTRALCVWNTTPRCISNWILTASARAPYKSPKQIISPFSPNSSSSGLISRDYRFTNKRWVYQSNRTPFDDLNCFEYRLILT